jgi:hypothetical protein
MVPSDQVAKMFSNSISQHYVVVEVAIYPRDGQDFDVQSFDFSLRVGGQVSHAERPQDVAPWPGAPHSSSRLPVNVTTETGVIYGRSNDPVYGRRQGVGTYEGVGIETGGSRQPDPPPSKSGPDPRIVEEKVRDQALPEGRTRTAIAGYLYFPQYAKRKKSDPVELDYSKDDLSAKLPFPK